MINLNAVEYAIVLLMRFILIPPLWLIWTILGAATDAVDSIYICVDQIFWLPMAEDIEEEEEDGTV